jgi:hypothetical protein
MGASVPKASVNEHDRPMLRQDNVWRPRQPLVMQREPKAAPMQIAADDKLWLRVFLLD